MKRRSFIAGALCAAAIGGTTRAQQAGKVYRLAVVSPSMPTSELNENSSFRVYSIVFAELRRLGFIEGRNLEVERYSAEGHIERYDPLAREIANRRPDVILAATSLLTVHLKAATGPIPIVSGMADPVSFGLVTDLAKPGGNITGSSADAGLQLWGKRVHLLQEADPRISRLAFLASRAANPLVSSVERYVRSAGLEILSSRLEDDTEEAYRQFFAEIAADAANGLLATDEFSNLIHQRLIVEKLKELRLPSIFGYREQVQLGALMAYAFDLESAQKYLAAAVAQILNGTKPADIPIYQSSKFELIVNLKTAKSLGLTVPVTLLARADEVIE